MIIPDLEELLKETNQLNLSKEVEDKIIQVYNFCKGFKETEIENIDEFIKDILKNIFNSNFTSDIMIPFDFINTNIGKILFYAKFGIEEELYSIKDLIELSKTPERPKGFTKQYIKQEIDAHRLKAFKRSYRWYITKAEVNRFLEKKESKS